jgi:hypothetical protein
MQIKNIFFQIIKPNNLLLLIGSIIIISCFFLPLSESCELINIGKDEFRNTQKYGYELFTYQLSFIFIFFIVFFCFNRENKFKHLIISVIIGGILTTLSGFMDSLSMGGPCINAPTNYQNLLYIGHIIVIISSFIRLYFLKKIN